MLHLSEPNRDLLTRYLPQQNPIELARQALENLRPDLQSFADRKNNLNARAEALRSELAAVEAEQQTLSPEEERLVALSNELENIISSEAVQG